MRSIVEREPTGRSFLCGAFGQLEKHHIFGGPNRKWSEKYGLTVHLCPVCHRDNRKGVHGNAGKMLALHQAGQREFERRYSHKKFMEVFGKNYLDTEEEAAVSDSLSGICFLEET